MISFKRASLYVLIMIIIFRSSSVLRIIEVNTTLEKNWNIINYYFSFIVFPIAILLLLKGNFKECKKLFVLEEKNKIGQITFFSFLMYLFFCISYAMLSYVIIVVVVNVPIEFNKMTYSFSSMLYSIVIVPFFEELFFRRVLAHQFFNKYGLKRAIFYSAFLFMLVHNLSNGGLLDLFLFGSIFAFIYLKTRNIYIVIVLHMLNNFYHIYFSRTAASLLLFFEDYKHINYFLNYFWWYYFLGFLISIFVFYYSFRYINRYYAKYIHQ